MGGYLLNRILQSLIVIFLISIISFALIHAAPGDSAIAIYGPRIQELRPADRARIRENLGLNRPLPVQYARWLERVMHGDLGYSYRTGEPVWNSIVEKVPATFLLAGVSTLLILLLSIILGVLTGIRRNSWLDHLTTVTSLTLVSTPNFWLALMLILIFGVWLGVQVKWIRDRHEAFTWIATHRHVKFHGDFSRPHRSSGQFPWPLKIFGERPKSRIWMDVHKESQDELARVRQILTLFPEAEVTVSQADPHAPAVNYRATRLKRAVAKDGTTP